MAAKAAPAAEATMVEDLTGPKSGEDISLVWR